MMTEEQIPNYIQEVAETGCNITAVLGVGYTIGDADLSEDEYEVAAPLLKEINARYGERDHLFPQIVEYLVSIGRNYPRAPDRTSAGLH